jgi:hypothetical protein
VGSKILYHQVDLYREIKSLFKSPTVRRVAISAFVGKGAESYLPNPEGIALVCWPKAGGTNPIALRTLMAKKVDVWFADQLHMKVYWAEGRGCVLTSASLSTNALGSGNLKEVGILIGPDVMDIDRLLLSLDRRRVTDAELKKLDREHSRFVALNRFQTEASIPSFLQWLNSPMPPDWKLGWAGSHGEPSQAAKDRAKEEFGVSKLAYYLGVRENDYRRDGGEWILTFMLAKNSPAELTWMFSDFVVRVHRKDEEFDKDYPCEVVQVWSLSRYPGCPFRIDAAFRNAFKRAVKRYGADRIREASTTKPTKKFIHLIAAEFDQTEKDR